MSEKIWYEDVPGLFTAKNYYIIIPLQSLTFEEKLNAIVRFFIYLGVILSLVMSNATHLLWGIIALATTVVVYKYQQKTKERVQDYLKDKKVDVIDNSVCKRTTVDNPFMNPSVDEYGTKVNYETACPIENESVYEKVNDNFHKRLFQDCSDIYDKMSSQRQFYTMPNTSVPNDQEGFAQWVYGSPPTCKEGNGFACMTQSFDDAQRRAGNGSGGTA
jgi:hypothetical protein